MLLFVFFLLHVSGGPSSKDPSVWEHKLAQLNLEGAVTLLPGVGCLCLAFQWGGFTYSVSPFPLAMKPRRPDRTTVEQWTHHRLTYDCFRLVGCFCLNPNLETPDSRGTTAHLHPAKHPRRLLGKLHGWCPHDAVR